MTNQSYFTTEIIKDKESTDKVVIKYYSPTLKREYVHKTTAYLQKYAKDVQKNKRIAEELTSFLNFVNKKVQNNKLRNLESLTFVEGKEYFSSISNDTPKHVLKNKKRLLVKFLHFMAKNDMLRRVSTKDFDKDRKNPDMLKLPF